MLRIMPFSAIQSFIRHEAFSGLLLFAAALLAVALDNSAMSWAYDAILNTPASVSVGDLKLDKPLLLWINDGLMAIFFLLVGLELKREFLEGQLSTKDQIILPGLAAIGGIVLPAAVYITINWSSPELMKGWAIPTATDIAFALGILSLLGNRVPLSLKIFLMALAILDDLGAIVIIAVLYTVDLSILSIAFATAALALLVFFNWIGVARKAAYIILGVVLWVSVLKSGVHATLAGVALAFTIPLNAKGENGLPFSPAKEIEHDLHNWVAFLILPLFAFVNAGVALSAISPEQMAGPVPLGIILGLFIGKQAGVFGFSWLAIKLGLAQLPKGSDWMKFYGVCILTGIGFTMSLFIDSLAFEDDRIFGYADKLAILIGSFLSGVVGYLVIRTTPNHTRVPK